MSYHPGPGGIAAPDYGQRPPRRRRAGLFIVLMVLLLVGVLVSFALIATRVFTDLRSADPPGPATSVAPVSSPTPKKPTKSPAAKPTPKPSTTKAAATADQVAEQFVVLLNLNDVKGATALACADTQRPVSVLIGQFVRPPTLLTVSRTSVSSAGPIAVYALSGSTKGADASGILVMEVASRPCVKSLAVH